MNSKMMKRKLSIISILLLLLFSFAITSCSKEAKARKTIEKYIEDVNGRDDAYEFLYIDIITLCKNFDDDYMMQYEIDSYMNTILKHQLYSHLYEFSEGQYKSSSIMQDSVYVDRFSLKFVNDTYVKDYGGDKCAVFLYRGKDSDGEIKNQCGIYMLNDRLNKVEKNCKNMYYKFALCELMYHDICKENCEEIKKFSDIRTH